MSKFFRGESDSDSSDSENEEVEAVEVLNDKFGKSKSTMETQKFQYESSSEDEEKRTVRTEKSKRWEQLQGTIKTIKNQVKISDWANCNKTLQELDKQLGKAKAITSKEGVPRFYFKTYMDVASAFEEARSAGKKKGAKKVNRLQSKAMNAQEQNHKKWQKLWEKQLVIYMKNPMTDDEERRLGEGSESDEESDSDSGSSDDEKKKPKVEKKLRKESTKKEKADSSESEEETMNEGGEGDDEGDDEEWSQSDDDDDDDDTGLGFEEGNDVGPQFNRDFWVKIEFKKDYTEVDTAAAKRAKIAKSREDRKKKEEEEAAQKKLDGDKKKVDKKEITTEDIVKKLKDLHASRGKKGTNNNQVKDEISMLVKEAKTTALKLKCLLLLATTLIDLTLNKGEFMAAPVWKELAACVKNIVALLISDKKVMLAEDDLEREDAFEHEDDIESMTMEALMQTEEEKKKKEEERVAQREAEDKKRIEAGDAAGIQYISGNLYSFIQVLFNEFTKSLQKIDYSTPDYVTRLKDELILLELISFAQEYYSSINKYNFSTRIVLYRLQLLYYRYDPAKDSMVINSSRQEATDAELKERRSRLLFNEPKPGPTDFMAVNDGSLVHELAAYLYKHGSDVQKINALLCHIYYFALHNRYDAGRELLLMSHVQDSINDCDLRTRILYNRAMAQMGLAAFRAGATRDCLYALADFYQFNRTKELLAQGLMPRRHDQMTDRDKKDQALERLRQVPYHMHINLDVLEAVHLLSAMLLEVPNVAQWGFDKKKAMSKAFRKYLEHHLKQAFNGPPENTRDSVMAASKAMLNGDWKGAWKHVSNLKVWVLFANKDLIFPRLLEDLKRESLKTYILNYGAQYTTMKQSDLCEMFELEEVEVYRVCSKMMVSDQLKGDWNQPDKSIAMRAEEPTHMQKTALKYVDKVMLFLENNERLIDNRSFGYDAFPSRWGKAGAAGAKGRKPFTQFRKSNQAHQQRFAQKKKISTRTWAAIK